MVRGLLGRARRWEGETQKQERTHGGGTPSTRALSEEETRESADAERGNCADQDVPGPGDVRDRGRTEMHRECSLPNPKIETEAADHADDCAELCGEARECAEQEDTQQ